MESQVNNYPLYFRKDLTSTKKKKKICPWVIQLKRKEAMLKLLAKKENLEQMYLYAVQ